ncbi:MAG: tRNA (N6-threonylcarbamoyladenosine(37)-N6)-methyltransferase TrmO [Marinilabiliaceae bacterium]|nr:tRNA (N6-threonylcarbamoyladenosine(37)-N6)-methyltransferase TrmO [Marinilabiliaceae bacterium]
MEINYKPIGIIHSSFQNVEGTPIQPGGAKNSKGIIEIFPEFTEGLKDIDGFSHIILLYHFHLLSKSSLSVKPFMDTVSHGIFSTRSPARPNHIGLSVVKLKEFIGNKLIIENVDIIDGSPLIDIKPYVPDFDSVKADRIGWLEDNVHKHKTTRDDGRFI